MGIIKKQSIFYTIVSYIGLAIGAANTLFLMPHFLTQEQVGLVGVFSAIAFPLAAISNLGSIFAINRFLPYYKKELPPQKIDLPILTVGISFIGFIIVMSISFFCKEYIFQWFSDSPLLLDYFYVLPIFMSGYLFCSIFQALNNGYFYTVWVGWVTEVIFRVFHLVLIVLIVVGVFTFNTYFLTYIFMFWLGIILYITKLKRSGPWYFFTSVSTLTKRMKGFIIQYSSFFWFTSVLAVLGTMIDSLVLAGVSGLEKTGSLMIATYIITVTQIPQRGIVSVSVPVIAESWRKKDMANLGLVYHKSANNMLWSGGFILLCILINMNEILAFLPPAYHEIKWVVPVLGLAKLFDYSTGVNQNILSLSRKNWRWDFYTNLLLILMLVPLNYFLIKNMGLIGAAWANAIAYFIYNLVRTFFVWKATNLTPLHSKNIKIMALVFLIYAICLLYLAQFPVSENSIIFNILLIIIKSVIFGLTYVFTIYKLDISDDLKELLKSQPILKRILK